MLKFTLLFNVLKAASSKAPSTRIRFPSVFILFSVLKGVENNGPITWNNMKTLWKCIRVDVALSLVHTSDISIGTRSIRKQSTTSPLGLAKTKQREFFFVSPFVLLLAYGWTMVLCLWRSLCRRLDFIPLFCPYAYAIVWTRLNLSRWRS